MDLTELPQCQQCTEAEMGRGGLSRARAQQAAVAIEHARLCEEALQRQREAELLAELVRTINASLDLSSVLQRVADGAKDLCGSDIVSIALREPTSGAMVIRYRAGTRYQAYETVHIQPGKGIGGQAFVTGSPIHTDDYAKDPCVSKEYLDVIEAEGIISALAVPIWIANRVDGILYMANRSPQPFTDRDEAILLRLADHAAIAIQNAHLFEETERRRRAAQNLADVGRLISQSLNLETVAQQLTDSVRTLYGALCVCLYRLEPGSEILSVVAISGAKGPTLGPHAVLPPGTGTVGRAVCERRPAVTPDCLSDPRISFPPEVRVAVERSSHRATLAVPLLIGERVIGALSIEDRDGRVFTEDEVRLLQTFADQAAVALENVRLYQEVRDARDFLKSIAENSADAIVTTDIHGRITYFSPGAEEIFGYRAAEVLGQPIAIYHRGGLPETRSVEQRLMGDERIRNYETAIQAKDERWVEVNASISLLRDVSGTIIGTVGVIKDITERQRAQEALRAANILLEKTFASLTEAVFIVDATTRTIISCNPAAERIFGYSMDEVVGRNTEFLYVDRAMYEAFGQALTQALNAHGVHHAENQMRRKDGSIFCTEHTVTALVDDLGHRTRVVSVVRDITERRQLQEQLAQSQKMKAIERLAGEVSHNFNNLLTVISVYSQLLQKRLGHGNSLHRLAEEMKKAVDRAAGLTRQLLAFSRKQELQPTVLDLNAVIGDMEEMLRCLVGEGITLVTVPGKRLGRVSIDPGQLEQIILNLVINACDAMPQGGSLTIETANMALDKRPGGHRAGVRGGSYVMLAVGDTGCGMDAATRSRLFEPFFTTKLRHTGLGLASSYGIINQSGGHIDVDSAPGKGTTFRIYLPRAEQASVARRTSAASRRPPQESETVLRVEDNEPVQTGVGEGFQASG
ncbi:MAG TPA: PAS domain S-box protein [Candidatus Tectomicrobia bacterium]|nr:PAS domain S-box protein [Candidatus Tectomicrobia bacterium]